MDGGVDDEITAVEAFNCKQFQSEVNEYSLKPNSSEMLELHEVVMTREGDVHESSHNLFADILDGKDLMIGVSEQACASPRCMDHAEVMVEELTLRNYSSDNLAIVGTSNNRDKMQSRQNPWQHLYQIASGSGIRGSHGDTAYRDNSKGMVSAWEDVGYTKFPEFLDKKPPNGDHNEVVENLMTDENKPVSNNTLFCSGGIRTKVLSKSGFSEYFVKNTLKGMGVVCRGPAQERFGVEFKDQTYPKAASATMVESSASLNPSGETFVPPSHGIDEPSPTLRPDAFHGGISLREWLKAGQHKVNKVESLYIFRQIVDLVDFSHSRGVALRDLWPSSFKLLPSNQVMYLGSSVQKEIVENVRDQDFHRPEKDQNERRPLEQGIFPVVSQWAKKRKFGENMNFMRRPQFPNRSGIKSATAHNTNVNIVGPQDSGNEFKEEHKAKTEYKMQSRSSGPYMSNSPQMLLTSVSDPLEEKWYTSPEELSERCCTFASNIYCLGILLFELLGSFDSRSAHAVAMLDMRNRILPPNFMSENPKEARLCLWLLHPEPSSRPGTREILQSEVIGGIQELRGDEVTLSINQVDAESELLLHFLMSLGEQKQNNATKLMEEIRCLGADIEEVERRQTENLLVLSCLPNESLSARGNRFLHRERPNLKVNSNLLPLSYDELRLTRNITQLESAYFSERSNVQLSDNDVTTRANKELLKSRENWYRTRKDEEKYKPTDCLGLFFNGLCKYSRYSKFEVRGILRNGDFNNSANVICSLSFDRDEDYFAAAGVSKKIKIYDFHALFNDSVDIHHPVVEISNKSRLSCICWNSYIKNYLASTDYDGVVKLWDAGTGQGISQYIEHDRRAWSVDFSQVDPTKLASGSDDCSVKLWNINEKNSLRTIRNIANVCCVQFSADSTHLLAFGSADYKTYCYDLRNVSTPWCILAGHDRAVSYVKFLDSETLVTASTDNTLKLWDLNKTSSTGLSTNACILTLKGHTNEKNFVGLSVAGGYLTCGSETNEVFAYYRSLPMPITSYKFGSVDPISGKETDDDNGQFVSSVCWRRKSDMVVAANSNGCIKLLQMV